ncbi:Ni/Fe hydrogenase subunit alpha [Piscinibacter sakaiensis]|uniref:Ni/Fe hydrogenase subunit alpha n=1 Tax=Piscinibacter sakaiensis TaxID=1547922 RepID=UPI003AB0F3EE
MSANPAPPLRRVAIDPVSRVEGHGKVTLLLDAQDRVQQARLHIVEFRGFESFIVGRPYWEVPVMVQRLCGICPVSHHLAASKAIDVALGVAGIPPTAQAMRRLMHYGQIMQSHAVHFFHLSSPDLLFGFDSEVTRRNIVGLAAAFPDLARQGVALRKFGQEVIRLTAGKRVHGTGSVPGGVNRHLTAADRDGLAAQVPQMIAWCEQAVELVAQLHAKDRELYDHFGSFASNWLSIVDRSGALDLYDGVLRARDPAGRLLVDGADVQQYLDLIEERTEPWTYMKFPHLRALGPDAGWYRVGPLARMHNCDLVPSPRAEAQRQRLLADGPAQATLAYHWARMIEMLHAMEVIADILDDEALLGGDLVAPLPGQRPSLREGVGVIEAPRGTLIHHYAIGDDDLVTWCNLIVSTTHNNRAMNESIRSVADRYFDGRAISEGLLNHIEVAVRAYDPCLSCATHALGSMPLEVDLVDASGGLRDRVLRDGDGHFGRAA